MITVRRISRQAGMGPLDWEGAEAREVHTWVASRLAGLGLSVAPDPWSMAGGRDLSEADARILHAALGEIVDRATSLVVGTNISESTDTIRVALDREAEGIVRALTNNPTALDGTVFTRLFEWPGHIPSGDVEFYLWYAPMKTLRSIAQWLGDVTSSEGVAVHERAFLLRALGRLDPSAAVATARDLVVQSPWATSEVLGMFGGAQELELMRFVLRRVASEEEARTRRHFEAGMRKIERRIARERKRV